MMSDAGYTQNSFSSADLCRVDGMRRPVLCSLFSLPKKIIEKMNGQGAGAETIPFSVAVKAQGNIEDWLCDLLFKMQVTCYTNYWSSKLPSSYILRISR